MRAYHEKHFLNDARRIPVTVVPTDHALEHYRGIGFFENLLGAPIAAPHRSLFVASFYFETLIDQAVHHHFGLHHPRFQAARPLPKFGRFGTGPHISPPAAFLNAARNEWSLADEGLGPLLARGARYFPRWVAEFFVRHEVPVPPSELFQAIGDQDLGDLGIVRWTIDLAP